MSEPKHTPNNKKHRKSRKGISFSTAGFTIFMVIILGLIGFLAWQADYLAGILPEPVRSTDNPSQATTDTPPEKTAVPTNTPPEVVVPQPQMPTLPPVQDGILPGLIIFSMTEAGYSHLFAYHPETLPVTRLTFGDWDDRHPSISPDGTQVAFTSNRSGHWDIYLLNLDTGQTIQFTDEPDYNGHPSWSSDGLWLAYEKYQDMNLDIFVKPMVEGIQEVRVTNHPAQDFEPAWKPGSTTLAFTSTRTGSLDIFLVDTNLTSSIENFTNNSTQNQIHPVWTPDNTSITWTAPVDGFPTQYRVDVAQEASTAQPTTNGTLFAYDPSGNYLVSIQNTPDQYYMSILESDRYRYTLLPTLLDGHVDDISWGLNRLPVNLPPTIAQAARAEPQSDWKDQLVPSSGALYGRQNIIDLPGIVAPHAALSALAVEPFFALKDRAALELGWDVLSDLENMFVSIAQPLPPGRSNDWLYTGRAFSLNPVLIDYEYMAIVREVYGPKTYWRVYLKPLDQSGSQGVPLTQFTWDFDSRYSGSPTAYEAGGEQGSEIPEGYWVDFTELAFDYGWERLAALSNWQSYYHGARFNVFVITSGLTWEDAMLQIWPPEVFQNQDDP